jgi:hypothetical protein
MFRLKGQDTSCACIWLVALARPQGQHCSSSGLSMLRHTATSALSVTDAVCRCLCLTTVMYVPNKQCVSFYFTVPPHQLRGTPQSDYFYVPKSLTNKDSSTCFSEFPFSFFARYLREESSVGFYSS